MKNIETIKDKYTSIIYNTNNLKDLDKVRISAVGKKGEISCMLQEIGKMSIDQKKQMGPLLNSLKNDIINQIDQKKKELEKVLEQTTCMDEEDYETFIKCFASQFRNFEIYQKDKN